MLRMMAKRAGHFCNKVIDPVSCCPLSHGTDPQGGRVGEEECTCLNEGHLEGFEKREIR